MSNEVLNAIRKRRVVRDMSFELKPPLPEKGSRD